MHAREQPFGDGPSRPPEVIRGWREQLRVLRLEQSALVHVAVIRSLQLLGRGRDRFAEVQLFQHLQQIRGVHQPLPPIARKRLSESIAISKAGIEMQRSGWLLNEVWPFLLALYAQYSAVVGDIVAGIKNEQNKIRPNVEGAV